MSARGFALAIALVSSFGCGNEPSNPRNEFTSPGASITIVAHGDSITQGVGVLEPYLPKLAKQLKRLGLVVNYRNRGINGQGFEYIYPTSRERNLIDDAPAFVDGARVQGTKNFLVVFAGTNDIWLGKKSGRETFFLFVHYLESRIDAGSDAKHVIVCTMLPREGNLKAVDAAAYNSLLVSSAKDYGYQVARLDLDERLSAPSAPKSGLTFLPDQIHPNDQGHEIIAETLVRSVLMTASIH